jgi:glutathione S-transferase
VQLYSGPLSLFTAKVRIALDEKQIRYERVEVGWSLASRYEPHHPAVVRHNPKQQVPVLVDGDVAVYDSTLIFEYLEDRRPEPSLMPRDVAGRARCRRLEAYADEIFFQPLWSVVEEVLYPAPPAGRDAARLASARAQLASHYAWLDAELGDRTWFCGDAFSFADVALFVMTRAASGLGAGPAAEQTRLTAWYDRTLARPAVQREVDAMNAFLKGVLEVRPAA